MEKFLHHVNVTMRQKHNDKQLSLVVDRIESYDAIDAPTDECDKVSPSPDLYTLPLRAAFLPRDAVLARYMLSSCVRPSVRPSYAGIVSKRLDESSCFFAMEASFHLSHTVFYRNMGISKIRYFSLGLCSQTQHLENFATASRSRYQRNSLSPSSTVEFVDDTYRTIDESINCNPLTPLVAICCGFLVQLVSTADKILTDIQRVARSVCGSRVS